MHNTLHEYAIKYKQIPQLLNKQSKMDIILIRNKYKKVYALMRIYTIRKKYKYINTPSHSLLQLYMKYCFYHWKGLIWSTQQTQHQHKQQFALHLCYVIQKRFVKAQAHVFYVIVNAYYNIKCTRFTCCNNEHESVNTFYRRLSSLVPLITIKQKRSYKTHFEKWKQHIVHYSRTRIQRLRKSFSSSSINITQMIINNMSTILLAYETEDTKLKHDLSKLKTYLRINSILIRCIITKHNMIMLKCFAKWLRISNTHSSYITLLSKYEALKKENDGLIEVYYDKKSRYKKVIADYEYMKQHYCRDCMGEDVEIDYKSLNNNNEVFTSDNETLPVESEDECNRGNKIAEKESSIKEYQNEYSQQQKYYEEYLNSMHKKKEKLLAMKQMLLHNNNSKSNI